MSRVFAMPAGPVAAVRDVSLRDRPWRPHRGARAVGLRQVDAAAHAGLRRHASRRHAALRRPRRGALSDASAACSACRHIGFVFQRFFLLPMLTAAENVEFPQSEAGMATPERRGAHA